MIKFYVHYSNSYKSYWKCPSARKSVIFSMINFLLLCSLNGFRILLCTYKLSTVCLIVHLSVHLEMHQKTCFSMGEMLNKIPQQQSYNEHVQKPWLLTKSSIFYVTHRTRAKNALITHIYLDHVLPDQLKKSYILCVVTFKSRVLS